ncbi:MAG: hypothetical protein ACXIUL_12285 [Wenzhouxiangella sp.]
MLTIQLPEGAAMAEIDEIYQTLYAAQNTSGNPLADGCTASGSQMAILNFSDMSNADYAALVSGTLDGRYKIILDTIYSNLVERSQYGYSEKGGATPGRSPVQGRLDRIRQLTARGWTEEVARAREAESLGEPESLGQPELSASGGGGDGSGLVIRPAQWSAGRQDAAPEPQLAPLPGAPRVRGATGPDPRIVRVAEAYAAKNNIDLRRQATIVEVDKKVAKTSRKPMKRCSMPRMTPLSAGPIRR